MVNTVNEIFRTIENFKEQTKNFGKQRVNFISYEAERKYLDRFIS